MADVGLDIGVETVKTVVLQQNRIVGSSVMKAGLNRVQTIEASLDAALEEAGLIRADVDGAVSTGIGLRDVRFSSGQVSEIAADACGASWLHPAARTVIDVGSEQARAIRLNEQGQVIDFARNQKCASGVGTFIQAMARALEITVEEIGPLSLTSTNPLSMNSTCVVFAESEVVSLIHAKTPKPDIARAIHQVVAARTAALVQRLGVLEDVCFVGGVARNPGVTALLENLLGVKLHVPRDPQLVGALGAALAAAARRGQ